ncbi:MAG: type II secretion system protein [Pseudomonadota bacterium]|nr:type II secretion system protein [Pseudomonadota bacterium]
MILLITLAVVGVTTAAAVQAGARMGRRSAEEQLLIIGEEFQKALLSYGGGTLGAGPMELSELLKDPRFPGIRRHLRRIYQDPLTGSATWGLRRDPTGRITGVYSLAPGVPIKRTGFGTSRNTFEEAQSYQDWVFGLQSQNVRTLR